EEHPRQGVRQRHRGQAQEELGPALRSRRKTVRAAEQERGIAPALALRGEPARKPGGAELAPTLIQRHARGSARHPAPDAPAFRFEQLRSRFSARAGLGADFDQLDSQVAWHAPRVVLKRFVDPARSEEHTSELQSRGHLVCRLLLEKKKKKT